MRAFFYWLVFALIMFSTLSSFAQELERPKYGSFYQQKQEVEIERDAIWTETNFFTPKNVIRAPRITPENYRKPVDMAGIVSGMERAKQSRNNQAIINNIRLSVASYQKDEKPSFRVNSSLESNLNSRLPSGTCVHGYLQGYCNFCSPRNNFGNFSRHSIYNAPLHPMLRGYNNYP